MRCKPGDLAVIVRADNDPECIGRIVTVLALRFAMGEPGWQVDPPHFWHNGAGQRFEVMWHDDDLRPIRDPGEDAQDETLQWLPVPEREGVAA